MTARALTVGCEPGSVCVTMQYRDGQSSPAMAGLQARASHHERDSAHRGADRLAAISANDTIIEARQLVGNAASAMIVDYERSSEVHGTWHSRTLHYFDMTLSRRPKGALGRFEEQVGKAQPVGPILFAPAGYHYKGCGGPGRQKTLALVIEAARLIAEEELDEAIAKGLPHCLSLEGESLRGLLSRIEREVAAPGFASALLLDGLCLSLLVETARSLRAVQTRAVRRGGLSPRNLRLIDDRVRSEGDAPTLTELAELCGLSPRQLVRAFHIETDRTIGDYIQRVMLERAQQLLADTVLPVADVGRQVGFSSPSAFSTAFRRLSGQSPRSYRANHQLEHVLPR